MIVGGLLLAGLGVGLALGNPGSGVLIGLGVGLVIQHMVDRDWIRNRKGRESED